MSNCLAHKEVKLLLETAHFASSNPGQGGITLLAQTQARHLIMYHCICTACEDLYNKTEGGLK